jgi:TRAP-type C4-dicarboxylate transport system permease small subunit
MDVLEWLCVVIAGVALVVISIIVPWGVFMRYALNRASGWPEPMAILLTVLLTFVGGAACYRRSAHMRVLIVRDSLPPVLNRAGGVVAELVVAALALFMLSYGAGLVEATWNQVVPEFPLLRVGITYLPIPAGGALLLCFVLERLVLGPVGSAAADASAGK